MDYSSILFLDIECVSSHASYSELSPAMQSLWDIKASQLYRNEAQLPESEFTFSDKAAIFAEFGKIVCISVGIMVKEGDSWAVRLKSYANDDEKILLKEFCQLLNENKRLTKLCGHNIKNFDIPYICRRLVVHEMQMPRLLDISGKKPWDLEYMLDTMNMWQFGDIRSFIKLSALTAIFGIPTPKDDIDGSEVGRVYWEENDLERIAVYCQKDVLAVIQVFLKYNREDLIPEDKVFINNN